MQSVNYYDVLGVSSVADDFVIKAAYKTLAQRYHPDKFHGNAKDAADAQVKMRQLNEAYQVLSDPAKRRDYDAHFQQGAQQNQQSSQQKSEQAKQQSDWAIALRFYPDLTELETRLGKIDPSLIPEFRSSLLATQQYEQRQRVASQLEQSYLEDYFGNDSHIVDFARELLLSGKRDGAKELNRMVKVVGGGVSSEKIVEQLELQYFPNRRAKRERERQYKRDNERADVKKAEKPSENEKNIGIILIISICMIFYSAYRYFYFQPATVQAKYEQAAVDFVDNHDGTVTNTKTGLQWKRCSEGQSWTGDSCKGEANLYTWNEAVELTSKFIGKKDWRLPSLEELNTLVYCSNGKQRKFRDEGAVSIEHEGSSGCGSDKKGDYQNPTISTEMFPNTPSRLFWSSTLVTDNDDTAWYVSFERGDDGVFQKRYVGAVRLVRNSRH